MAKIFFLWLLTSLFVLNAFDPPFFGDSRPPRNIRIGSKVFAEFKPGMANLEIVVEENAYKTTRFAASELKKYLEQRLKTQIPVVKTPGQGKISICLGINRWSREAGIADTTLCRDAFIIKTSGRKIFILGKDDPKADPVDLLSTGHHLAVDQCYQRATLFGVYDFLERFAGIRFFFPHEYGIVVPQGAFKIPETDIYDRPDFECRWYSPYNGYWRDELADPSKCRGQVKRRGRMATPEKNLSWYRNRMHTRHIANVHGMAHLNLKRRFHQSHPEYFALKANGTRSCDLKDSHSGQLCFASGVKEVVFQDAKAYLTGQPAKSRGIPRWAPSSCNEGMFSMAQPDGFTPCRCPECWKYFSQGPAASSNRVWGFVCDIARRLQHEKVPGYLLNLAYNGYREVPNVEIPSNLWVQVVVEGPWGERLPEIQKRNDELVRNWVLKKKGKVWLWNHALKWGVMTIPGVPSGAPRAFAKYYKKMAPYIYGAFVESGTDYFIFHYLTYYVYGKIAWNNQLDPDQLLKEHARAMFGPAAGEMEKFLDRFEYLWLRRVLGKSIDTPIGTVAVTATAAELWNEIYSEAELASLRQMLKKSEQLAAGNKEVLQRIRYVGNAFLEPVEKELRKNQALKNSIASFSANVAPCPPEEPIRIDGELDDAVWKRSEKLFMQPFKKRPELPADETIVRLAQDRDFLYVAFDCKEPQMDRIKAPTRENPNNFSFHENSVEIFLNPDCRKQECLQLMVNSNGVPFRLKWIVGGNKFVPGSKWEGDFRIATRLKKDSWTAEIAIPKESLPGFDGKKMLANFTRNQVKELTAFYSWSPFMNNNFQEISNFGTLLFQPSEKKNLISAGNFADAKRTPRRVGSWSITKADAAIGKIELDRTSFISGGASLKLSGLQNGRQRTGIVQSLRLKPRTRYVLSFYAKSENVMPFDKKTYGSGAAVMLWYDKKNHTFPLGWITGTTPWTFYVHEFQTGDDTEKSSPYIVLRLAWAGGSVWFDNITIHEM